MIDKFLEQFHAIDLSAPDATWQLIVLMLKSLPWEFALWVTLIGLMGGALIGWYKNALWRDVLISLLIMPPFGWMISLALPAKRQKCTACGYQNRMSAKNCRQCNAKLEHASPIQQPQ